MSEELLGLIATQENAIVIIKNAVSNFKKAPKTRLTRGYVKTVKANLEKNWNNFVDTDRNIFKIAKKEDKTLPYFTQNFYSVYEETYINLTSDLTDMLEISEQSLSQVSAISAPSMNEDIKLQPIKIPQFTGNYLDWTSFNDLFTSLIHKRKSFSNVQKMHHLKSYLSGEPEQLLKHLSITDDNYELAWNTLKSRYNNKRIIVNSIMSRLLNQKKITNGTAKSIRDILDTTMECLNKLKGQDVDTTSWDAIVIYITVTKLDNETHKEWEGEASKLSISELPSMSTFKQFLERRFRVLEMLQPTINTGSIANQYISNQPQFSESFHVTPELKTCVFCKQNHPIHLCKEFQQLTLEKKTDFVQNERLCFNCLNLGHQVQFCTNKTSCQKCGRRHHSLLHRNTPSQFPEREKKEQPSQEPKEKEIINHLTTGSITALLSTAQIKVINEQGREFVLRALLDPCSQESFISESAAQTMGLKRIHVNGHVSGIGQMRTPIRFAADIEISSRLNPEKKMKITTYIVKRVTNIMPSEKQNIENWEHLKDLELADPTYYQPGPIDVLLGVDVYNEVIQPGLIKGVSGTPIAIQTYLGWILSGKITVGEDKVDHNKPLISMHLNVELNNMPRKFWELETIEEEKEKLTAEEKKVEELYEKTTTKDEDGRYIVPLTLRNNPPILPQNTKDIIAINRWKASENKLKKKPNLMDEYNKVIEEYVTLTHMEKIETDDKVTKNNATYLPHHAVIKEERETFKVRVVFVWIYVDTMKWKPFVKNRILDIIEKFDANYWFYVNTKHNLADPAARGVMSSKLITTTIWRKGPEMLKEREVVLDKGKPIDTLLEKRKCIITALVIENESEEKLTLVRRYSSLEKLVRVVAYCRRWMKVRKKNKDSRKYLPTYLTHEERSEALTMIAQELELSEGFENLKAGQQWTTKSRLLSLSPLWDEKSVVRVGGRLKHANMEFIHKHNDHFSRQRVVTIDIARSSCKDPTWTATDDDKDKELYNVQ